MLGSGGSSVRGVCCRALEGTPIDEGMVALAQAVQRLISSASSDVRDTTSTILMGFFGGSLVWKLSFYY